MHGEQENTLSGCCFFRVNTCLRFCVFLFFFVCEIRSACVPHLSHTVCVTLGPEVTWLYTRRVGWRRPLSETLMIMISEPLGVSCFTLFVCLGKQRPYWYVTILACPCVHTVLNRSVIGSFGKQTCTGSERRRLKFDIFGKWSYKLIHLNSPLAAVKLIPTRLNIAGNSEAAI